MHNIILLSDGTVVFLVVTPLLVFATAIVLVFIAIANYIIKKCPHCGSHDTKETGKKTESGKTVLILFCNSCGKTFEVPETDPSDAQMYMTGWD